MGFKILIVDDHEVVRQGIRTILRSRPQWEVCGEAINGRDAIEKTKSLDPDVIIMDITMPEMSGIEATRRILAAHPDVVVFLCSTYDAGDLPPDAAASGASAYLNKEKFGAEVLGRLWADRGERSFQTA